MKRRRLFLISAASAIALIALLAFVFFPCENEPAYQGKTLSEWVAMAQEDPHPAAVDTAIIAIGTNNLPLLLKWLDYKPSKLREWIDDPYSNKLQAKLRLLLRNRAEERADTAKATFRVLGMRAVAAIPELLRQLREHAETFDSRALWCLSYMGEASFPLVASIAADKKSPVRPEAVGCIGNMRDLGTNRTTAVRQVCALASDSDRFVVIAALTGLGKLGAEPEIVLPVLITGMRSPDLRIKARAIWSIGRFGTNACSVLPELVNALDDADLKCRNMATNAVNAIAPEFFKTNGIEVRPGSRNVSGALQVLTNGSSSAHE